jgi:hypothetical protein
MRYVTIGILVGLFAAQGCNEHAQPAKPSLQSEETIPYPKRGLICFHQNGDRQTRITLKLGDSLPRVLEYLDLKIDSTNSNVTLQLKRPIVRQSKFGTTAITAFVTLDKSSRMKNFKAQWLYSGDTSVKARANFYNIILDYAMPCLWEQGPEIYKQVDTFTIYSENYVEEFITDLRKKTWQVNYECRLK